MAQQVAEQASIAQEKALLVELVSSGCISADEYASLLRKLESLA